MSALDNISVLPNEAITVGFFFNQIREKFNISVYSDDSGFDKKISGQNLHRPGLALAGFVELFTSTRVQIFGNTEIRYLENLSLEKRLESLERIFDFYIPCIVFTDGNIPFPEIVELSNKHHVAVFGSPHPTTKTIFLLSAFLDDQFAPICNIHGSFVDVYGVGMLFIGDPGIGKSEVALDLIERGHRFISDDVTILTKKGENIIMGTGTDLNKHFMEIRGIGLIDVSKIFGIRAIRYQKRLEVIVELKLFQKGEESEQIGLSEAFTTILDVEIPYVKLPIVPGKNITVISEVVAVQYLLRHYGYNSAAAFQKRQKDFLDKNISPFAHRGVFYFENDNE